MNHRKRHLGVRSFQLRNPELDSISRSKVVQKWSYPIDSEMDIKPPRILKDPGSSIMILRTKYFGGSSIMRGLLI
jgi:hypothetical protein